MVTQEISVQFRYIHLLEIESFLACNAFIAFNETCIGYVAFYADKPDPNGFRYLKAISLHIMND